MKNQREVKHECNCEVCNCGNEVAKVEKEGMDGILSPFTNKIMNIKTPYSVFYNYSTDSQGMENPEDVHPMDLYMRRNMILNIWRDRVNFLINNLESFLTTKHEQYVPIISIVYSDHSYLLDLLNFSNMITSDNAVYIANSIGITAYNSLASRAYNAKNQEEYNDILVQAHAIAGQIMLGMNSILEILMCEYGQYSAYALITPENSRICRSSEELFDITVCWGEQPRSVNPYKRS